MTATDREAPVAEVDPDAESGRRARTSIVLPAYNEVENVEPLLEEILEVFRDPANEEYAPVEILFVDDGSTDGTRDLLVDLAEEHEPVRAVLLRRNFGQGAAIAAGIDNATGQYLVTMDSDGQVDPADVPRLLAEIEAGADCVSGWRRERKDSLAKTVPSAVQGYLARLTGPDINDFSCTLTAYRTAALRDIDIYGEGYRYIPAKLFKHGYTIEEIEVSHRPRTAGRSKYGPARLLKGFIDLLFHAFWNRYSARPAHFLSGLGVVLVGVGGVIGLHALALKYVFGAELLPKTPRLILTVALILFGFQLFMFGFLAEMIQKLYYDDHSAYSIEQIV